MRPPTDRRPGTGPGGGGVTVTGLKGEAALLLVLSDGAGDLLMAVLLFGASVVGLFLGAAGRWTVLDPELLLLAGEIAGDGVDPDISPGLKPAGLSLQDKKRE